MFVHFSHEQDLQILFVHKQRCFAHSICSYIRCFICSKTRCLSSFKNEMPHLFSLYKNKMLNSFSSFTNKMNHFIQFENETLHSFIQWDTSIVQQMWGKFQLYSSALTKFQMIGSRLKTLARQSLRPKSSRQKDQSTETVARIRNHKHKDDKIYSYCC